MMESNKLKAVIAGGGLAGLACAKRLVDGGFQVTLVEAEAQLGGRTASWVDQTDGQTIESGVHTFFGPYSHLIRLLNEVGVEIEEIVSWSDKVAFLKSGSPLNIFGLDPLRNLGQFLGGLLGNNNLISPLAKITIGLAFANGLLRLPYYENFTVAQFARDGGIDSQTYERILRPLSRGLAFCEPEELSAQVLLTLILDNATKPWNLQVGTFKGGMSKVLIEPIARWLQSQGAHLKTHSPLRNIRLDNATEYSSGNITGFELENGEVLQGDVYASALPLEVLQKLIPARLSQLPYFDKILRPETVPATAVQLWFDRTFISRDEFIFLSNSPVVVLQDESRITFPYVGSRISCQITDRKKDDYSDQQLIDLALREIQRFIPASNTAQFQKAVVVRHRAIAIKPGVQRLRPRQTSPVPNFFLAGDYTRQNWFTTMEGATISGERVAAGVLQHNWPTSSVIEDMPEIIYQS